MTGEPAEEEKQQREGCLGCFADGCLIGALTAFLPVVAFCLIVDVMIKTVIS